MKRRATEDGAARWRIDVHDTERLCYFDVDIDGRTYALTAGAARALRDSLTELLAAANRSADQEAERAAPADRPGRV